MIIIDIVARVVFEESLGILTMNTQGLLLLLDCSHNLGGHSLQHDYLLCSIKSGTPQESLRRADKLFPVVACQSTVIE
jgi:hypothetical protein